MKKDPKITKRYRLKTAALVLGSIGLGLLLLGRNINERDDNLHNNNQAHKTSLLAQSGTDAGQRPTISLNVTSNDTVELNFDEAAWVNSEKTTYYDPYTGAPLTFVLNKSVVNTNSTSIVGSVTINSISQPMTITLSPTGSFASIPLESGSFSGSGPTTKIRLIRNKPISDRVVYNDPLDPRPLTVAPKEIKHKCINCGP